MYFLSRTNKTSLRLIFALALSGSVLSFLPFYSYFNTSFEEGTDDGVRSSYLYRESAIGTLILVMPTSMDIILDVLLLIISTITIGRSSITKKPIDPIVIVRLTLIERSLFVVGVAMQSIVILPPLNAPYLPLLYRCAGNCSALLTICPILMFLERCTMTFSYPTTLSVSLFTAIGAACQSASYCYDSKTAEAKRIFFIGSLFFIFAAVIYLMTSILCISYYIRNNILRKNLHKNSASCPNPQGGLKEIKVIDEMFENYIPAAHIISGIMFVLLNAAWNFLTIGDGAQCAQISYVLIGIATWVLLVEYRIRKNEVERGLVRLPPFFIYFIFQIFMFSVLMIFMYYFHPCTTLFW